MSLEQVMDKWMDDPAFRDEMRRDPEGAVQQAGFELSQEDKSALKDVDWQQPDERLQQRISKLYKKA